MSSVTSGDFLDLTDIGGICGENGGVVSACRNSGAVGYPNTAYNVGGIVGLGQDVFDCCAVCQVERASEYAGAVAGWAEGTVKNNVYTLSTFAGVDDASLTGECLPVSEAEFLAREDIPNGDGIVYRQAEKPSINPRVILLAAFSALGVLLIALFLLRRRRGKGKPKNKKTKRRVK